MRERIEVRVKALAGDSPLILAFSADASVDRHLELLTGSTN